MLANRKMQGQGDRGRTRAYLRDFLPGIVGYAVVLGLVVTFVDQDSHSRWRYVWMVLPVVPALWIVRAMVRHLRRIDEYQRLLQLESIAAGFGTAMAASLTLGVLGKSGLAPNASGWIIYGAGMAAWGVSALIKSTRAR
jgi:hypothetical protein